MNTILERLEKLEAGLPQEVRGRRRGSRLMKPMSLQ